MCNNTDSGEEDHMNIRDQIVTRIQSLPESALPEVYEFLGKFQEKKTPGLLRRLQEIKIEGPRDFARNIDLYLSGEKKIEENLP